MSPFRVLSAKLNLKKTPFRPAPFQKKQTKCQVVKKGMAFITARGYFYIDQAFHNTLKRLFIATVCGLSLFPTLAFFICHPGPKMHQDESLFESADHLTMWDEVKHPHVPVIQLFDLAALECAVMRSTKEKTFIKGLRPTLCTYTRMIFKHHFAHEERCRRCKW